MQVNKALEKALVKLLEVRALIAIMLTVCTVSLAILGRLTTAWLTLYSGAICAYYFTDKYMQGKDGDSNDKTI